ncbi:MAG: LD-carboxypeptidase [Myxococcota bacterium]
MARPLRPGDRIRVIAPSGAFDRERFDAGIAILEAEGFEPLVDPRLLSRSRYLAGDDASRLAGVLEGLAEPGIAALWAARGGYGATRIVEHVNPRKDSQWLVGFSDITALHARWFRAGAPSIHGANITTLGEWSEEARRELFAILGGECHQHFDGEAQVTGAASGRLVGGNLTVLASMCGTRHLPVFRDSIVVLEDIGEATYRIDRALTQLLRASDLSEAAGFVLGQLTRCGDDALEVLIEELSRFGKPLVSGLPLGHEPSSRAIVLGTMARIDGSAVRVTLDSSRLGVA